MASKKNQNLNNPSPALGVRYIFSKFEQILSLLPLTFFKKNSCNIAVIRLQGVIGMKSGFKNNLTLEGLNSLIENAFKVTNLRALCLVINSPGGSPVQSELIAARIRQLAQQENIPVYAFVEDIAASGGYWLACAADKIFATKNSIIGSIGVISSGFGFHEVIKKLGIERRVYSEGRNKSILDPFMPENKKDVELLSKTLKQVHKNFIEYVQERRGNKITQDDEVIYNGEFWTGVTAMDFGLIDDIDNMYNFLYKEFGKKVNINYINQKQSWFKSKLGIKGIVGSVIDESIDHLHQKSVWDKFKML